ncbi:MAG: transporter [Acidocella sp.]|nr:transporter [Acidocella sp.]
MWIQRLGERACLTLATLLLSLGAHAARAGSDPYPGEGIAPPANLNIVLVYQRFTDAGSYAQPDGSVYSHNTRISTDAMVVRYIRTFNVGSMVGGVQAVGSYINYLGNQELGTGNIAAPAGLPRGTPSYGPGHAALSANNGFAEPLIGAFLFPYADRQTGTYWVVAPWIGVPLGSYSSESTLNATSNLWTFEMETGFRTTLLGSPTGRNLALELWGEGYVFGTNGDAGSTSPAVYANNIPSVYDTLNTITHGLVPDSNPLRQASTVSAHLHEQPSAELRVYLPYEFFPPTHAVVSPGLFQSFGGKQTYTLSDGRKVDAGTRTQTTQLRLVVSTFISPHVEVMLAGSYDLVAHGAPLNRGVMLRIGTFF